ncbi:MAG: hypothetical protein CL566_04495 [Alphaproteobacteria bacterium]|nr:hypothetical protein [Alphaproteobacteria bacterium]
MNLAAKLEKHTKHEDACAVATKEVYNLALDQGFTPGEQSEQRNGWAVEEVEGFVDIVALGRKRSLV